MTRVRTVRQGVLGGLLIILAAGCHKSNNASNPDGGDASMTDAISMHDAVDRVDMMPDLPTDTGPMCPPPASKALGATCTCGTECASGFCADGVCCSSACTEGCRTCAAAGSPGTCTNLPTGSSPGATAGKSTCVAQDVSMCGRDGKCDGAG